MDIAEKKLNVKEKRKFSVVKVMSTYMCKTLKSHMHYDHTKFINEIKGLLHVQNGVQLKRSKYEIDTIYRFGEKLNMKCCLKSMRYNINFSRAFMQNNTLLLAFTKIFVTFCRSV